MRKLIYNLSIFFAVLLLISGCFRDDSEELKEKEQRLLEKYLLDNGITQEPTASGLYFILIKDTIGQSPGITDVVEFEYTGELVNGEVFGTTYKEVAEEEDIYSKNAVYGPVRLILQNALAGLTEGFQLMEEGEKAMMILPSDIAYGGNSVGIISRYSTLIFNIHLQKVISDPMAHENILIKNFMDENGLSGQPTESGLYYFESVEGEGELIPYGSRVNVYYDGYFLDGRVFDSNNDDPSPLSINIPSDMIIDGWNEGIQLMKKGSKGTLIVPYDLAYGEIGTNVISPYMTLVFDMHIVDVY
jgi:FKBP-type peptidyl-prolyl cis-trans isomerase FkpA